jgi:hypothetical protein
VVTVANRALPVTAALRGLQRTAVTVRATEWLARRLPGGRAPLALAALSCVPLAVLAVAAALGQSLEPFAVGWIVWYVPITLVAIAAPRWILRAVAEMGPDVDDLVVERADTAAVAGWLDRLARPRRQLLICLFILAFTTVGEYLRYHRHDAVDPGPAFYVVSGITMFWLCDGTIWLLALPLFVRRLLRVPRLRLVPHAPVSTPGIRRLSQLFLTIAVLLALAWFLLAVREGWSIVLEVEHHELDAGVVVAGVGPFVIALLVSVYVMYLPQRWLGQIADRHRDRMLDEIAVTLPSEDPLALLDEDVAKRRALYDAIAGVQTRTVGTRTLSRLALLVIGALSPYVASLVKALVS